MWRLKKSLKKMPEQVEAIRNRLRGKKLEIWVQDEARFGLLGSQRRTWAQRGSRPRKLVQTVYKWLYLWGAVCPATGAGVGMISPTVNTEWMNVHLRLISDEVGTDGHVILLMDRAGWHVSKGLDVPENISILLLPPYSPELNPMELVWLYIKSHYMDGPLFTGYQELEDAACNSWNLMDEEKLKSITGLKWLEIHNV